MINNCNSIFYKNNNKTLCVDITPLCEDFCVEFGIKLTQLVNIIKNKIQIKSFHLRSPKINAVFSLFPDSSFDENDYEWYFSFPKQSTIHNKSFKKFYKNISNIFFYNYSYFME